jgi:hypothetical protein
MLRHYQVGELLGIVLMLATSAMQIFYLEPLKREIEWRLAAFSTQQSAQVQTAALYATRLAILEAVNAPAAALDATRRERDQTLDRFKTADANIADYVMAKGDVEDRLQVLAIVLFIIGTLLASLGRVAELRERWRTK